MNYCRFNFHTSNLFRILLNLINFKLTSTGRHRFLILTLNIYFYFLIYNFLFLTLFWKTSLHYSILIIITLLFRAFDFMSSHFFWDILPYFSHFFMKNLYIIFGVYTYCFHWLFFLCFTVDQLVLSFLKPFSWVQWLLGTAVRTGVVHPFGAGMLRGETIDTSTTRQHFLLGRNVNFRVERLVTNYTPAFVPMRYLMWVFKIPSLLMVKKRFLQI